MIALVADIAGGRDIAVLVGREDIFALLIAKQQSLGGTLERRFGEGEVVAEEQVADIGDLGAESSLNIEVA